MYCEIGENPIYDQSFETIELLRLILLLESVKRAWITSTALRVCSQINLFESALPPTIFEANYDVPTVTD